MKTIHLGPDGPLISRLAYGCMRILHTWDPAEVTDERHAQALRSIRAAWEAGFTCFDTADIYCRGECEKILGHAIHEIPNMADDATVITRCGLRFANDPPGSPKRFDQSAQHILASAEASLKRLNVEYIDVFLLRGPDPLMQPAEVADALDQLRKTGKVAHVGLSNFSLAQIDLLSDFCDQPLLCNQLELHPGRISPFEDDQLLNLLRREITPLATNPINRGLFATGARVPDHEPNAENLRNVIDVLDGLAMQYDATRAAITLAWLMRHPAGIVPIIGATDPEHIRQAAHADLITLSRDDWYRVLIAARGHDLY